MLRKNTLGQYSTKDGRFIVRPRWTEEDWHKQAGWYLWEKGQGRETVVETLAEAREIIRKRTGGAK